MTVINSTAMPIQTLPSYPVGANSAMTAGIIKAQQQAELQNALVSKGGRRRRIKRHSSKKRQYSKRRYSKRRYSKRRCSKRRCSKRRCSRRKGGAPLVAVPPVPSGTVNPSLTEANYKALTQLAQTQSGQAVYDSAKTSGDTAAIATKQQMLYNS